MPDIANTMDVKTAFTKISEDLRAILTEQARQDERLSNVISNQDEQRVMLGEIKTTLSLHNDKLAAHSATLHDICERMGEFRVLPSQITILQERDRQKSELIAELQKKALEMDEKYDKINLEIAKYSIIFSLVTTALVTIVSRLAGGLFQ